MAKKKKVDALVEQATSPRIAELKASLRRSQRKIDSLEETKREYAQLLVDAAKDNLHICKFAPVKAPTFSKKPKEEVAVAMCADWQTGKKTPSYNVDVLEREIKYYANRIARITEIHRKGYPVRNLHVWALGDMVEGELIFPGQAHRIEASLYQQTLVHGPRIFVDFLRTMLTIFERVDVWCVPGNHGSLGGRARKDMHPESNADLFLYKHVMALFEQAGEKRIKFRLPPMEDIEHGDKPWYLIDEIGNYSCFLFHGDQIKAYSTFPWYGFGKKIKGWKALGSDPRLPLRPFKDAACGHYHQDVKFPLAGVKVRVCGSPERYETHVIETLADAGLPSQHFMFVEPRRGRVTAEYEIDLSEA